jgi:hypothetical protein
MCEEATAIELPYLPLGFDSSNPEHRAFMQACRANLKTYLKKRKYAPKKESPKPNRFRDDIIFAWASQLISEGLKDGNGNPVHLIDAVAFGHWLYHGFSAFKDMVVHDHLTVTGFCVEIKDGVMTCYYSAPNAEKSSVPSTYLAENWCSWSSKQFGGMCLGEPKNLYKEFEAPITSGSKVHSSPKPKSGGGANSA